DNLTPSSKLFVRKYASTRAFQILIKIGALKAHVLIDTGAQCSDLSSGLVKRAFDKQSLQLPICGKIKVADGAVVNAHGPVVVTMESAFREHIIKSNPKKSKLNNGYGRLNLIHTHGPLDSWRLPSTPN
uniref:Peptidase A2 domain-containing protein n=1 Tax=Romanomermis culicivorax TaxID=13658 RepID=A0A915KVB0_ROMCU